MDDGQIVVLDLDIVERWQLILNHVGDDQRQFMIVGIVGIR